MQDLKLKIENRDVSISYNQHFANLAKVTEALSFGTLEHYKKTGLTYIDVPEIVGITGACENVDTLFKVVSKQGLPLFFTQTGQLSLEQALQVFPGVCTVLYSGRDEEYEDERHLRQFRLTEEEFDCTLAGMTRKNYDDEVMFETLLTHIQNVIQTMISAVLKNCSAVLTEYGRDQAALKYVIKNAFLRITYEDAITLLNKHGYDLVFGADLEAEHEAKIVELVNANSKHQLPVFIMKYPLEIKFFNMKQWSKDKRLVLSADLILPYAGESVGSAVREHDFDKLNQRLLGSTMFKLHLERGGVYEDFAWYLDIIRKQGTNPHAGYGIGNERVLQYIFGTTDIRMISLMGLLNMQTGDWVKKEVVRVGMLKKKNQKQKLSE